MKRTRLLLVLATVSFVGCGNLLEPAAAVVNDRKIPLGTIEESLETFRSMEKYDQLVGQGDVDAVERQYEQGQLATLVRREVLEPKVEELGIEITEEEVKEQIDTIRADFPTQGAFEEALAEQAIAPSQLPDLVRDRLIEEALRAEVTKDAGATEEELRAEFESRVDEFVETHTAHILVDSQAVAQEISDQLNAAPPGRVEDLFAELAEERSTDRQSAKQGGDLGYTRPGQFVAEFEDAVAELEEGEISQPVESEFGFHVIRLIDRRAVPFEEVRDELDQEISGTAEDEAWQAWLEDAYRDADVRVNPRFGELDISTGQITDAAAEDIPGAEAPQEEEPAVDASLSPAP
ncbi:MAG: peptidylprolyl isomerase [Actinomycetota bacterium]